MSNWPRGQADYSSSNWTARTPSKPRDTAWHPIGRQTRVNHFWIFNSAFLLLLILGVIPLVGLLLGYFGE
jgi:hypothetical protein